MKDVLVVQRGECEICQRITLYLHLNGGKVIDWCTDYTILD